ncbi:hypothetical protein BDW69DRAFT_117961 [Aspergillus filifer]
MYQASLAEHAATASGLTRQVSALYKINCGRNWGATAWSSWCWRDACPGEAANNPINLALEDGNKDNPIVLKRYVRYFLLLGWT